MSFPCYSSYKDSGVEWLGEIPSHWGCEPLKYSTEIYTGNSLNDTEKQQYESIDENDIPYVSSKDLDLQTRTINYENGLRVPVESNKLKVAPKNSFLLCIEGGSAGKKIALLKQDVCFVNKLCCFKDKNDARFKYFLAQSKNFKDKFDLSMTGLIGGVSTSALKNFSTPVPSDEERDSIVNFLEYETSKIDTLIAEQIKLIELLKEKRQAVISNAVTKGLNPNVKMKNSGVVWLGDIPDHWGVRAIKHIVSTPVTDGPHETPEFFDDGVPFVSAEAVSSGEIDFSKIRGYISLESHKQYSLKYLPKKGDIFMIKSGATTGVTAIVETDQEFNIWSPLAVIRCNAESNPYYVLNFMRSLNFQEAVALNWNFGTQQNIGMGVIENLFCPVPSQQEQKAIAEYLTSFTKQFNTLISEANNAIELLKERRSALISAAVTGQIDVRNYQPKEVA